MDSPSTPVRRRLLAALGGTLCLPLWAQGLPKLVLAGTEDTRRTVYGDWLDAIYTEALRRLGYQLVYHVYPSRRADAMARQGQVDGEINRVAAYGDSHPDLVRVDESHFSMRFAAYATRVRGAMNGWSALKGQQLRVEYCAGVLAAQNALENVVPAGYLSMVPNVRQGLRKLVAGRTDVFIDIEGIIDQELAGAEFANANVVKLGIMEERAFFAYLRKNRAELAPRLAQVLKEMKREGTLEDLKHRGQTPKRGV